jgi:ACS family hexuronate transporter-like MFS transporter
MFGPMVVLFLQKRGVRLIIARRGAFTLGVHDGRGVCRLGREPVYGDRLAQPGRLCAPDLVRHGHHHVVRPVPGRNEVATVAGMCGTFGNFGLLLFSLLIGGLMAHVGYTPFFISLACWTW